MSWWSLTPPKASTFATEVDAIYSALWAMTVFFVVLIAGLIAVFAVKYRRSKRLTTPEKTVTSLALELSWCIIPLIGGLAFFTWGTKTYLAMAANAPADAYTIFVTGKQWMWKFQHPAGRREINDLHIPMGRPIKLLMVSQDVIHSFFVPAFRLKHDVLPMTYSQLWFTPTLEGSFHIFCAEYCGTDHSAMKGQVIVMRPAAFAEWLASSPAEGSPANEGEALLQDLGCRACHAATGTSIGPRLEGIFGHDVQLSDGSSVVADENYLRESILTPTAKIVAGYQPVMPPYGGRITEEQLTAIITYIRSKGP
jgi:cytochrome c oxidase subunit 2